MNSLKIVICFFIILTVCFYMFPNINPYHKNVNHLPSQITKRFRMFEYIGSLFYVLVVIILVSFYDYIHFFMNFFEINESDKNTRSLGYAIFFVNHFICLFIFIFGVERLCVRRKRHFYYYIANGYLETGLNIFNILLSSFLCIIMIILLVVIDNVLTLNRFEKMIAFVLTLIFILVGVRYIYARQEIDVNGKKSAKSKINF